MELEGPQPPTQKKSEKILQLAHFIKSNCGLISNYNSQMLLKKKKKILILFQSTWGKHHSAPFNLQINNKSTMIALFNKSNSCSSPLLTFYLCYISRLSRLVQGIISINCDLKYLIKGPFVFHYFCQVIHFGTVAHHISDSSCVFNSV